MPTLRFLSGARRTHGCRTAAGRAMRFAWMLALLQPACAYPRTAPPNLESSPPRIQSLIAEAWSIEQHAVRPEEYRLAAAMYCEAARFGSAEAHFRAGLLFHLGPAPIRDAGAAKSFLYFAQELGHPRVDPYLKALADVPIHQPDCLTREEAYRELSGFDLASYVQRLPRQSRDIAELVQQLARVYAVPADLAVAIAAVESNFNPLAESPKRARGVMQLIPATAERFGVRNVWSAEENIRGGLQYLRKLMQLFPGKTDWVIAAYNAGEGAVIRHQGIPPYYETRSYVHRVLSYARTHARHAQEKRGTTAD